jgi:hypothetical protein
MADSPTTVYHRTGSPPTSSALRNGVLAQDWDVLHDEAPEALGLSGLPMFGDRFPD